MVSDLKYVNSVLSDFFMPQAERLFVSKDLQIVMEKMWEAREKWYNIGLCFEIPSSQLDVIKKDSKDTDEMFTSMIKEWLGRGHSCTWSTAHDALKNPIVDKGSVAEKLGEWLRDKGQQNKIKVFCILLSVVSC